MKATATAVKWGSLDQTSQKIVVHNVLKFLQPKEVDRLVTDWDQKDETTLWIDQTKKLSVEPFITLVNRDGDGEMSSKNERDDDDSSLLLFQKYNISFPKYLENEEIRDTYAKLETSECLESCFLPLFYDEIPLHSSSTNSYGLDPKIIECSPLTTTAENDQLSHESNLPVTLCFESEPIKADTVNRKKSQLPKMKHFFTRVAYLPPSVLRAS